MSVRAWWRYLLPAEVRRLAWEEYGSLLKIAVILLACSGVKWLLWAKWRESPIYFFLVRLDDWLAVAMVAWILMLRCARFFKERK